MARGGFSMGFDRRRYDRALASLRTRELPPVAERVVMAATNKIGSELTRAITGVDLVETGRYRAGWVEGVREATGAQVGPLTGNQPGDGFGSLDRDGLRVEATVSNRVPYGPELELGTPTRRPGLFIARALFSAARDLRRVTGRELAAAWEG